jgi:3-oxoacyl-[acyl-carrier-protein] synthase II
MRAALANANLSAGDIDLIIAHATGTPANDAAEFQALSDVFEARLGQTPLVAFKSHLGHTLGAAGAVELVLALLAMRDGLVPPVANVASDELEFDGLDLTFGGPRAAALSTALSLSIGFGGANACAVVRTPATTNGEGRTGPTEPAREVAVTGLGAIVPGAIGNEQLLELLLTERPVVRGGPIDDASLEPILARFRLRRQSAYSKLSIGAVSLALADAAIEDIGAFTAECGAIFGTAHGSANYSEAYYREIVASGPAAANPMLFAEGVPNAGAAQVSIAFGINGGCQTIVGARTSGVEALALAAARIRNGEWRRAIVCAADESNEAVNAGYEACGLTGPDGGFTPGAGAGAVVLELADDARARGATIAATIGACGLACAEIDDARSIERAIGLALDAASPAGPIVGSANGSRLDRIERDAVDRHPAASVQAYVALDSRLAEMFSAGPLVAMAGALLAWREFDSARAMAWVDASEISVLAVDPLGPVACVSLLRA